MKEGTVFEDWQSGIDEDLEFNSFEKNEVDGRVYWNLNYKCGNYYVYDKEIYLSSNSSSHISMEDNTFNFDFEYNVENVRVAIWKRTKIKLKYHGKYLSSKTILAQIEKTYFIENNTITVSDNYKLKIGTDYFDEDFWEYKNSGSASSRFLFLDYFPISNKNLKVVAKNSIDGSLIELNRNKKYFTRRPKRSLL